MRSRRDVRQVLFIQGAGEGAHDEWDATLVASLDEARRATDDLRYPRMPNEEDPSSGRWGAAIRREIASLADGAVVIGHSVGGTLLVQTLISGTHQQRLAGIVLISAPFVGLGGWPGDDFEFSADLGARLPQDVPVQVFHGLDDRTVPPSHARLYGDAIARAQVYLLPGRDHQLNTDLREVAAALDTFQ